MSLLSGDDLARPAKDLPLKVIRDLGHMLHRAQYSSGNWETIAEDLGYCYEEIKHFDTMANVRQEEPPGELMLRDWVQRTNGRTLFVLHSALYKAERLDCIEYLETEIYKRIVCMELMVCVRYEDGRSADHHCVRTRAESTLLDSLQNSLDQPVPVKYKLLDSCVSWMGTVAREFKGRQLMLLRKRDVDSMEQDPTVDSSGIEMSGIEESGSVIISQSVVTSSYCRTSQISATNSNIGTSQTCTVTGSLLKQDIKRNMGNSNNIQSSGACEQRPTLLVHFPVSYGDIHVQPSKPPSECQIVRPKTLQQYPDSHNKTVVCTQEKQSFRHNNLDVVSDKNELETLQKPMNISFSESKIHNVRPTIGGSSADIVQLNRGKTVNTYMDRNIADLSETCPKEFNTINYVATRMECNTSVTVQTESDSDSYQYKGLGQYRNPNGRDFDQFQHLKRNTNIDGKIDCLTNDKNMEHCDSSNDVDEYRCLDENMHPDEYRDSSANSRNQLEYNNARENRSPDRYRDPAEYIDPDVDQEACEYRDPCDYRDGCEYRDPCEYRDSSKSVTIDKFGAYGGDGNSEKYIDADEYRDPGVYRCTLDSENRFTSEEFVTSFQLRQADLIHRNSEEKPMREIDSKINKDLNSTEYLCPSDEVQSGDDSITLVKQRFKQDERNCSTVSSPYSLAQADLKSNKSEPEFGRSGHCFFKNENTASEFYADTCNSCPEFQRDIGNTNAMHTDMGIDDTANENSIHIEEPRLYLDFNRYDQGNTHTIAEEFKDNSEKLEVHGPLTVSGSNKIKSLHGPPRRFISEAHGRQSNNVKERQMYQYESLQRGLSCPSDFTYEKSLHFIDENKIITIADVFSPVNEETRIKDFEMATSAEEACRSKDSIESNSSKRHSFPIIRPGTNAKRTRLQRHTIHHGEKVVRFNEMFRREISLTDSPPLPPRGRLPALNTCEIVPKSERSDSNVSLLTTVNENEKAGQTCKIVIGGKSSRPPLDNLLADDKLFTHYNNLLQDIPGWSPLETENTIEKTMKDALSSDGYYILWYIRGRKNLVISVSFRAELINYRVHTKVLSGLLHYYITQGIYFEDVIQLLQYYMENGVRAPGSEQSSTSVSGYRIALKCPVFVQYEKRPAVSI